MERESGLVKWFDDSIGCGFISRQNGTEIFFHYSGIRGDGFKSLQEGQKANFQITDGSKDFQAIDVVIVKEIREKSTTDFPW